MSIPRASRRSLRGRKRAKVPAAKCFAEGVALREIASRYGTPVYVYSQRAIEDAFDELDRGLRRVPHLFCFAVKANGNLSILQLLAKRGSGFDIVSGGELEHLARIGVPGNRIVFSGVGKTREEIRAGLAYKHKGNSAAGILQFNVESAEELEVLTRRIFAPPQRPCATSRCFLARESRREAPAAIPTFPLGFREHKFGDELAGCASSLSAASQFEAHPLAGNQRSHRIADSGHWSRSAKR